MKMSSHPTFCGSQGIKDVQFNNDGRKFLSTGYDKVIKLWDTETGQAIRTFGEGKMFFVAKFHPNDDKQNVLMAGCQDKKVNPPPPPHTHTFAAWEAGSKSILQVTY
jgi:WD40 repeat protein